MIGNVMAGSKFALLQSAGTGGAAGAVVNAFVSTGAGVAAGTLTGSNLYNYFFSGQSTKDKEFLKSGSG
jgi:hypothetical protein